MHKIYVENPKRISRELKKLQTSLKVKLDIKNKEIILKGKEIDKFIASPIIEAVNKGFDTDTALLLRDENYIFECINIKALTRRTGLFSDSNYLSLTKSQIQTLCEAEAGGQTFYSTSKGFYKEFLE